MPVVSTCKQFDPGDTVYARFFGSEALLVEGIAKAHSPFPHYFCRLRDCVYLIPKIHLSTRNLLPLVEDGNRQQLKLPLALREAQGLP